ncbi:MAG: purine-nucleoside phosphorylase [Clostridia bacterium]|nr:purine-nucleoside phosphorylase [Clostridia bacterium]
MKNLTPTPHNCAKLGEIAKTVLLPGDAVRAKLIAEKFLTDVKLVNVVRNNYCFTGLYKGKPVSVMSTGMGCASMGIYSYELFNFYGVENAIRTGTIGSLNTNYVIKDIIVAENTITDTNYLGFYSKYGEGKLPCSTELLSQIKEVAKKTKKKIKVANIYTSDTFYNTEEGSAHQASLGVAGVEMECAALYYNAINAGKKALCVCTVSDEILTGKATSSEERQNNFLGMAELALDLAIKL